MGAPENRTVVLRDDEPWAAPGDDCMEFRLTYDGELLSYRTGGTNKNRSLHIHSIRKRFHTQLALLWAKHPVLLSLGPKNNQLSKIPSCGFDWVPLASKASGLTCGLDILMLRNSEPGRVLADIDNRLKSLFDALRMADSPEELGAKADSVQATPGPDETPFFTLLQDDRLITRVSVTTDTLLEPVPNVAIDNAVRLVIGVTIRPYDVHLGNLEYI